MYLYIYMYIYVYICIYICIEPSISFTSTQGFPSTLPKAEALTVCNGLRDFSLPAGDQTWLSGSKTYKLYRWHGTTISCIPLASL